MEVGDTVWVVRKLHLTAMSVGALPDSNGLMMIVEKGWLHQPKHKSQVYFTQREALLIIAIYRFYGVYYSHVYNEDIDP